MHARAVLFREVYSVHVCPIRGVYSYVYIYLKYGPECPVCFENWPEIVSYVCPCLLVIIPSH